MRGSQATFESEVVSAATSGRVPEREPTKAVGPVEPGTKSGG